VLLSIAETEENQLLRRTMNADEMPGPVSQTADELADEFVERPEDDDYDLLTFGEAGARLIEEVRKAQRDVVAHGASGDSAAEARAQARLDALVVAQARNRKPTLDEMHASGFFRRAD
jgi:hypothetical protein